MYKIIATDMDGTLLNSRNLISNENREAIIKAQEKGCKIVLASGRPIAAMKIFEKELKLAEYESYLIGFNGGQIIDCKTRETVFSLGLKENDIRYLFEKAEEYGVNVLTYNGGTILAKYDDEFARIEARYTNFPIKVIQSLDELDYTKTIKCMFVAEPVKIRECLEKLKKERKDKYFMSISDPHFLEICDINVNKGTAIKKLCEKLNIDLKYLITCGDSYNDKEMLEISGLSVAAANANEDIRKLCTYTSVTNDEHILKDVIDKFII